MNLRSMTSASLAFLILAALTGARTAEATVIFSDDFTSGTNGGLNGQAPQVRPGTETWRAAGVYTKDTTAGVVNSSGSGSANLAYSTFDSNLVYTLTARVFNNTTGTNWVGIGWTTQTTNTNAWNVAGTGTYWMLWRGDNEIRFFQGTGASGSSGATGVFIPGESNVLDLRVVLDLPANTFSALYKNPSASDWTSYTSGTLNSSLLNGINSVGFTTLTSSAGLQSFELVAVPEPSTLALAAAAIGLVAGLHRVVRRRQVNG